MFSTTGSVYLSQCCCDPVWHGFFWSPLLFDCLRVAELKQREGGDASTTGRYTLVSSSLVFLAHTSVCIKPFTRHSSAVKGSRRMPQLPGACTSRGVSKQAPLNPTATVTTPLFSAIEGASRAQPVILISPSYLSKW